MKGGQKQSPQLIRNVYRLRRKEKKGQREEKPKWKKEERTKNTTLRPGLPTRDRALGLDEKGPKDPQRWKKKKGRRLQHNAEEKRGLSKVNENLSNSSVTRSELWTRVEGSFRRSAAEGMVF